MLNEAGNSRKTSINSPLLSFCTSSVSSSSYSSSFFYNKAAAFDKQIKSSNNCIYVATNNSNNNIKDKAVNCEISNVYNMNDKMSSINKNVCAFDGFVDSISNNNDMNVCTKVGMESESNNTLNNICNNNACENSTRADTQHKNVNNYIENNQSKENKAETSKLLTVHTKNSKGHNQNNNSINDNTANALNYLNVSTARTSSVSDQIPVLNVLGNDTEGGKSRRIMQFYKSRVCPWYQHGKCHRGDLCNYAHSNEELRPRPDLTKTRMCPLLAECKSSTCAFAHSEAELRVTPAYYKVCLCIQYERRGWCSYGVKCRYAHGENELREVPLSLYSNEVKDENNENSKIFFEHENKLKYSDNNSSVKESNINECSSSSKSNNYNNNNFICNFPFYDSLYETSSNIKFSNNFTFKNEKKCVRNEEVFESEEKIKKMEKVEKEKKKQMHYNVSILKKCKEREEILINKKNDALTSTSTINFSSASNSSIFSSANASPYFSLSSYEYSYLNNNNTNNNILNNENNTMNIGATIEQPQSSLLHPSLTVLNDISHNNTLCSSSVSSSGVSVIQNGVLWAPFLPLNMPLYTYEKIEDSAEIAKTNVNNNISCNNDTSVKINIENNNYMDNNLYGYIPSSSYSRERNEKYNFASMPYSVSFPSNDEHIIMNDLKHPCINSLSDSTLSTRVTNVFYHNYCSTINNYLSGSFYRNDKSVSTLNNNSFPTIYFSYNDMNNIQNSSNCTAINEHSYSNMFPALSCNNNMFTTTDSDCIHDTNQYNSQLKYKICDDLEQNIFIDVDETSKKLEPKILRKKEIKQTKIRGREQIERGNSKCRSLSFSVFKEKLYNSFTFDDESICSDINDNIITNSRKKNINALMNTIETHKNMHEASINFNTKKNNDLNKIENGVSRRYKSINAIEVRERNRETKEVNENKNLKVINESNRILSNDTLLNKKFGKKNNLKHIKNSAELSSMDSDKNESTYVNRSVYKTIKKNSFLNNTFDTYTKINENNFFLFKKNECLDELFERDAELAAYQINRMFKGVSQKELMQVAPMQYED